MHTSSGLRCQPFWEKLSHPSCTKCLCDAKLDTREILWQRNRKWAEYTKENLIFAGNLGSFQRYNSLERVVFSARRHGWLFFHSANTQSKLFLHGFAEMRNSFVNFLLLFNPGGLSICCFISKAGKIASFSTYIPVVWLLFVQELHPLVIACRLGEIRMVEINGVVLLFQASSSFSCTTFHASQGR